MPDNSEDTNSQDEVSTLPKAPLAVLVVYFFFFFLSDLQGAGSVSVAGASGYATGLSFIPGLLAWRNYKVGSAWTYWGSLVFMGLMFFGQYLKMSAA